MGGAALYGSGSRGDFLDYTIQPIGAIWFLLALLWSELFLSLIYKYVCSMKERIWLVLGLSTLLFALGYVSAKYTWFPLSIQAGACATIFVVLGHLYRAFEGSLVHNSKRAGVSLFIIIWIIAIYRSFANENMSIVRCCFPDLMINFLGAICGSIAVVLGAKYIDRYENSLRKFCLLWGKNSLLVLCVHNVERTFLPYYWLERGVSSEYFRFLIMYILELIIITGLLVIIRCANHHRITILHFNIRRNRGD